MKTTLILATLVGLSIAAPTLANIKPALKEKREENDGLIGASEFWAKEKEKREEADGLIGASEFWAKEKEKREENDGLIGASEFWAKEKKE
ncbi:hypothetical protein V495_01466 [Pseudogymnoascus sp. VKM F-4514 (FW-929)]|nr:hypothetical protein V490_01385 [Pseudogymnoascus sp. VKM F-3557]KFY48277.1 hypothetical protein V495_01466 [Pseudogymnoascus sp. VKM F-4514 (FW-929)]KFY55764.1 hypothetical protein V497_06735 [Pseudogymnoascus sp. VKM F-4516 (FW-969)]